MSRLEAAIFCCGACFQSVVNLNDFNVGYKMKRLWLAPGFTYNYEYLLLCYRNIELNQVHAGLAQYWEIVCYHQESH